MHAWIVMREVDKHFPQPVAYLGFQKTPDGGPTATDRLAVVADDPPDKPDGKSAKDKATVFGRKADAECVALAVTARGFGLFKAVRVNWNGE